MTTTREKPWEKYRLGLNRIELAILDGKPIAIARRVSISTSGDHWGTNYSKGIEYAELKNRAEMLEIEIGTLRQITVADFIRRGGKILGEAKLELPGEEVGSFFQAVHEAVHGSEQQDLEDLLSRLSAEEQELLKRNGLRSKP